VNGLNCVVDTALNLIPSFYVILSAHRPRGIATNELDGQDIVDRCAHPSGSNALDESACGGARHGFDGLSDRRQPD
jgi:hypothetical protein